MGNTGAEYDYAIITVAESLSSYKCFNIGVCRDNLKTIDPDIYVTGYSGVSQADNPAYNQQLKRKIVTGSGKLVTNWQGYIMKPKAIHYSTDVVTGTSGGPVYVKDSNGVMTVIGICSGEDSDCNWGTRIDSNILHFIYNNEKLNS